MKLNILNALILAGTLSISYAQNPIPNPNFESWSGNNPDGWTPSTNIPGFDPVTKSTDAYSGNFAVRGEVINIAGAPLSPVLYTGTISEQNFPVTERFQTFTGRYKYSGVGGDMLFIEIIFTHTTQGGGAEGHAIISADASSYEEVEIQMEYDPNNPPGWEPNIGNITVTILPPENQLPHVGTWFLIDYFTFDGNAVSVNKLDDETAPNNFTLEQNFPNPFNPSTKINFSVPNESFVRLKIFDVQGEEIITLVNQNLNSGKYTVDWNALNIPSGVYLYSLQTSEDVLTKKMQLIK